MTPIVPCIWLDDQAEQAAAFYTGLFPGGRVTAVSHYPDGSDNPSRKPRGSVLTVEFELAGRRFTALNGGPIFTPNPSVSFFANVATASEAERIYGSLAAGGEALMPIGAYPWSERYGWVKDRYGVSWQVMAGPLHGLAAIAPCLMFTGPHYGRAEEALRAYVASFPNSRVDALERFTAAEGQEGKLKHGRFVLDGQLMVAMDGGGPHAFAFNEALSLQVMCDGQADVDRYWAALGEGGEPGVCGWLKDRFGLSWQVVPKSISAWMASRDPVARDRAFNALMKMKKLDVAALDRAFRGA